MADRSEIGAYAEAMRPIAERFEINGKMGLECKLSPDSAVAVAKTMMLLCRYIDLMHAEQHAANSLRQMGWSIAAFVALVAFLALSAS